MEFEIYLNNLKGDTSSPLFDDNKFRFVNDFRVKKMQKKSGYGNIRCEYVSNPSYKIVHLDVNMQSTYEVMSEFEGAAVVMAFMKTGASSCIANGLKGNISGNQNNIFFNNGLVTCHYKEADCFRIFLSHSYIRKLSRMYPQFLGPLMGAYEEHRGAISDHSHMVTTIEMGHILRSMKEVSSLPVGRELFLEAKIRELLYLQINQWNSSRDKYDSNLEKYKEQMQMACQYIEEHVNKPFSLYDVARAVGVCETILKLAFKYFYGETVFEYVNECRMEKACELLRDPSFGISDVAVMLGYEHLSHFSTVFKRKFGIAPLRYKKNGSL